MSFTDNMRKLIGLNWSFTMLEGVVTYQFFPPTNISIPEFEEVFGEGFIYLDNHIVDDVEYVLTAQKDL